MAARSDLQARGTAVRLAAAAAAVSHAKVELQREQVPLPQKVRRRRIVVQFLEARVVALLALADLPPERRVEAGGFSALLAREHRAQAVGGGRVSGHGTAVGQAGQDGEHAAHALRLELGRRVLVAEEAVHLHGHRLRHCYPGHDGRALHDLDTQAYCLRVGGDKWWQLQPSFPGKRKPWCCKIGTGRWTSRTALLINRSMCRRHAILCRRRGLSVRGGRSRMRRQARAVLSTGAQVRRET